MKMRKKEERTKTNSFVRGAHLVKKTQGRQTKETRSAVLKLVGIDRSTARVGMGLHLPQHKSILFKKKV